MCKTATSSRSFANLDKLAERRIMSADPAVRWDQAPCEGGVAMGVVSTAAGAPVAAAPKKRRDVGMVGLLFASVGSIIGSGWLFGALNASLVAGPASLISWVLGGAVVMLLALIHAELGGMYPVAGGSARFPHYAYGSLVGFASGWFAFIGAVTTAPIEVEAALQYAHRYVPGLTETVSGQVVVTPVGYLVAG